MFDRFSRRTFLAAAGAALVGTSLARAQAISQPVYAASDDALGLLPEGNSAEWSDGFDSFSKARQVRSFDPTLSVSAVSDVERALGEYSQIVNSGGWNVVPVGQPLRLGARGSNVLALRQRLAKSNDLDSNVTGSDVFDSYVEAAVKNFQARHGMAVDGVIGALTLSAMNIPADMRYRQLETNLVRLRSLSGFLGQRFVMVNVPAAEIETVENNRVYLRHTAVVGKIDRQTPILNSRIHQVNFNPYWTVPASIIRKDLIPIMQKEPNYLTEHTIRIYAPDGRELSPSEVNWNSDEAINYRFRQDPGENNSLGQMRINFDNPHQVYLHDTPNKNLFGKEVRFHSSGCVRVQNVREFVQWLLAENAGWDRAHIDEVIRSNERIDANLLNPVPLYLTYITAWSTPAGVVHFRDDIYDRDGLGPIALR
ncbi:MAG: L,D-transpeptidase family protein [Rhizobiales bacterium]|nr:L,D-transpeptidase family protein [Hyphomicrobiales bacterium]